MSPDRQLVYSLINIARRLKHVVRDSGNTGDQFIPYELLAQLDRRGRTLKQLSIALSCSKQEVSRQVQRAIDHQWVVLKPDPDDGRSKRVYFSEKGRRSLKGGRQLYENIESEWASVLGEKKIAHLKTILAELGELLPESTVEK